METMRETAGLTLRAILRYVRARGGDGAVRLVLGLAGETEPAEAYDDPRRWWSYETKINVFAAAAKVLGDESIGLHVGQSILSYSVNTPLRLGLLLLGGPAQLIRVIATTSAKFNSTADMSTLSSSKDVATVRYRLRAGYTPSRYDCDYTRGLLTQLPALFGRPPATVVHEACQLDGAEACVYTVRWRQRRWLSRRPAAPAGDASGDVLAGRMELLQRTVAELVAAEQPERALAIVAERAGFAVNAEAFLLVAGAAPGAPRQVHGYGLSPAEIEVLCAAPPTSFDGTLVVDIATPGRYYGYLVAFCRDFFDAERRMLDAYANLAAVALDALSALETAAEGRRMAESLLDLARRLTTARSAAEVAEVTAEAVRSVMAADSATVLLHTDGRLRVAASAGGGAEHLRKARGLSISRDDTELFERFRAGSGAARVYDRDDPDPYILGLLDTFGHDMMLVVDIALPGHPYGILVAAYDTPQHTAKARETAGRMTGVADQAATVLRTCELLESNWRLAHVDPLTGLSNRRAFLSALDTALGAGEGAVLFIDLDGFKQVNDALGHAAGDELLAAVAGRLGGCVRAGDVVARLGGDEFVVLTHGAAGAAAVPELAGRIGEALTEPIVVTGGETVRARASIGGTRFAAGEESRVVLHRADTAMYSAKRGAAAVAGQALR
ncbi:diguanylate cyclase domain-containing protein [Dactylosporangium sp. CA-052675]|uniref:diguanylate cyclase domain-containing protein n=1 Tax=Dactylosporangium sp. CA-052675 TaxID=3239927 RepID=UPI003D8FE1AD